MKARVPAHDMRIVPAHVFSLNDESIHGNAGRITNGHSGQRKNELWPSILFPIPGGISGVMRPKV